VTTSADEIIADSSHAAEDVDRGEPLDGLRLVAAIPAHALVRHHALPIGRPSRLRAARGCGIV
jgi:hypothetical protein